MGGVREERSSGLERVGEGCGGSQGDESSVARERRRTITQCVTHNGLNERVCVRGM